MARLAEEKPALGYHVILDLDSCTRYLELKLHLTADDVCLPFKSAIKDHGFTLMDTSFKCFDNKSWSSCFLLSESHVSVHTWPEMRYVSADVFVCNFSRDNRVNANQLSDWIIGFFGSEHYNVRRIGRR